MTSVNRPVVSAQHRAPDALIGQRLLERIGNTPLLKIERIGADFPNVEYLRQGGVV